MLLQKYDNKWCVKDCGIIFPNFSGRAGRFNPEGSRNFNIRITDPAIAQELINDHFNVRLLNKLDEDAPDNWAMKVNLVWKIDQKTGKKRGPLVKEVFENRTAELNDENIHALDQMTVKKCTVEFHAYEYEKGKCSAWMDRAKFWVVDDWFSDDEGEPIQDPLPFDVEDEDIPF